jgi:hypothetical protein
VGDAAGAGRCAAADGTSAGLAAGWFAAVGTGLLRGSVRRPNRFSPYFIGVSLWNNFHGTSTIRASGIYPARRRFPTLFVGIRLQG